MAAPLMGNRIVGRTRGSESYKWGTDCLAWSLIRETPLGIKEEWMPAGESELCHMHKESVQFFYILEGEARMEINEQDFGINTGEGILINTGEWHRIYCVKSPGVRFLVISNPDIKSDRIQRDTQAEIPFNVIDTSKTC